MDNYTKKIIYYMNNQNFQKKVDGYTHKYYYKSKDCGDILKIFLKVENDLIIDLGYEHTGCSLNVAALEVIFDYLLNKNINEIENLSKEIIEKELEVPQNKLHCINLVFDTFKNRE